MENQKKYWKKKIRYNIIKMEGWKVSMEEEKLRVKKLNYEELLETEAIVKDFLKKIEADYKETKAKGGQ